DQSYWPDLIRGPARNGEAEPMSQFVFVAIAIALVFLLAMRRASLAVWAGVATIMTFAWQIGLAGGGASAFGIWSLLAWIPALALAVLSIPEVHRSAIVEPAFRTIRRALPKVSETEQQALEAG